MADITKIAQEIIRLKMRKLSTYNSLPVAQLKGQGQDMPCTLATDYSFGVLKEEDFG